MVSCPLQTLADLCGIRIAYLMWSRRNVPSKYSITDEHFNDLVNDVLADVLKLPLPAQWENRVVKHVSVAGKQLLTLLSVWDKKTKFEYPQGNLLQTMLFDSLVLNANGLINPRKTAEKLLGDRILPGVLAFRLACINFLEKQVLKLWTLLFVKNYFLNKIVFYAAESEEVLFWLMYCLSRENSISINELPHFAGPGVDSYDFCLYHAAVSGNVACFDYFKNFCCVEYSYMRIIESIFEATRRDSRFYTSFLDYQQSCLIFHFALLKYEEKVELFRKYPKLMVTLLLTWPLTPAFVENCQEIWSLIPDEHKSWVFEYIFTVVFGDINAMYLYDYKPVWQITGKYFFEHLVRIWNDLWEISLDSYKSYVLDYCVLESITFYCLREDSFLDISNLIERLRRLFISNGEAVFQLYEKQNLKESLRSLIAKYFPEDFEQLDRNYISFFEVPFDRDNSLPESEYRFSPKTPCYRVHENFLSYVKEILFFSSRN